MHDYEKRVGGGYAFPDNVGFIVKLSNRRSFSPDAAFYKGELRDGLFLEGAPIFAVEVRSTDNGPKAEERMALKRADYFAAGTLVVWDVDVLREKLVRVYRAADPASPKIRACAAGLSDGSGRDFQLRTSVTRVRNSRNDPRNHTKICRC